MFVAKTSFASLAVICSGAIQISGKFRIPQVHVALVGDYCVVLWCEPGIPDGRLNSDVYLRPCASRGTYLCICGIWPALCYIFVGWSDCVLLSDSFHI